MKSIIVYYSLEGNTKSAAEKIAKMTGSELVAINPVKPLDSTSGSKFAVGGMQATFGMKPAISDMQTDFSAYDRIILGFPIWAGKCAPYINTFLKNNKVKDKISAVFTLSGGGDNEGCISRMKKKLPNLIFNVALADKANELAAKNDEKIEQFISLLS